MGSHDYWTICDTKSKLVQIYSRFLVQNTKIYDLMGYSLWYDREDYDSVIQESVFGKLFNFVMGLANSQLFLYK